MQDCTLRVTKNYYVVQTFSWFPLLGSRKIKVKETKSKVSNVYQIRLRKIKCVQEPPVPENELAIVSATKECTSEEDRVSMETNSKATVRRSLLILPSL